MERARKRSPRQYSRQSTLRGPTRTHRFLIYSARPVTARAKNMRGPSAGAVMISRCGLLALPPIRPQRNRTGFASSVTRPKDALAGSVVHTKLKTSHVHPVTRYTASVTGFLIPWRNSKPVSIAIPGDSQTSTRPATIRCGSAAWHAVIVTIHTMAITTFC